jgi:hypothetical protein
METVYKILDSMLEWKGFANWYYNLSDEQQTEFRADIFKSITQ